MCRDALWVQLATLVAPESMTDSDGPYQVPSELWSWISPVLLEPEHEEAATPCADPAPPQDIRPLVLTIKKSTDSRVTALALLKLSGVRHPKVADLLNRFRSHSETNIRWTAVEGLGRSGTPDAMEALLPSLGDEEDRVAARAGILLTRAAETVRPLLENHLHSQEPERRTLAAKALARIRPSDWVAQLSTLLEDDNAQVARSALELIQSGASAGDLPTLQEARARVGGAVGEALDGVLQELAAQNADPLDDALTAEPAPAPEDGESDDGPPGESPEAAGEAPGEEEEDPFVAIARMKREREERQRQLMEEKAREDSEEKTDDEGPPGADSEPAAEASPAADPPEVEELPTLGAADAFDASNDFAMSMPPPAPGGPDPEEAGAVLASSSAPAPAEAPGDDLEEASAESDGGDAAAEAMALLQMMSKGTALVGVDDEPPPEPPPPAPSDPGDDPLAIADPVSLADIEEPPELGDDPLANLPLAASSGPPPLVEEFVEPPQAPDPAAAAALAAMAGGVELAQPIELAQSVELAQPLDLAAHAAAPEKPDLDPEDLFSSADDDTISYVGRGPESRPPPKPDSSPGIDLDGVVAAPVSLGAPSPPPSRPKRTGPDAWITDLLERMVMQGATDLHLQPGSPPQLRKGRDLTSLGTELVDIAKVQEALAVLAPPTALSRFAETGDLDFSFGRKGLARFRCCSFRQGGAPAATFRVIPNDIPKLESLGVPDRVGDLLLRTSGLLLVAGPAGSGKTTTLASMVQLLRESRAVHVLTLEDPIEYLHPDKVGAVTQREVGADTESFLSGIRTASKMAPDVLVLGDLPDGATFEAALDACSAGRLVLAALPARGVEQALDVVLGLLDPVDRQRLLPSLASELLGVLAQAIMPRKDSGLVAAFEVLLESPQVAQAIRSGARGWIPEALRAPGLGSRSMEDSLFDLIRAGVVDPKEAVLRAANPLAFARRLEGQK